MKINILTVESNSLGKFIFFSPIFFLIFSVNCFSQTYTADYKNTNLSGLTPSCNILTSGPVIGGLYHTSYAGGVKYTPGTGIYLTTVPNTSPTQGTGYYIAFNMYATNTYVISITTSGGDGVETVNMSTNISNYPSSGQSACTPDPKVGSWFTTGSGATWTVPAASTTFTKSVTGVNGQYLLFYAQGGNPGYSLDEFYISKISIVASVSGVSISPTSLNYTCGNTVSQTFTSGYSGSTAPTNYTWNLGSVPNGWYYNGSPAPATILTNSTSLTLTVPTCSSTIPSPIYVVGNFPLGPVSSTKVIPALNTIGISGPANMCGQPTSYSISNLTCSSATYNWSATPAGNVSLSCTTCAAPTLTKIVSASNITLSASVSGACSATPLNFTKAVSVDATNTLTGTYTTSSSTYPLNTVNFVKGGSISGQYSWPGVSNQSLSHSGNATWYYGGNGTFGFYIDVSQTLTMNFSGTSSPCGTVTDTRTFVQSSFGNLVVTASPIPSDGTLDISLDQVPDTTLTLEKIQALSKTPFANSTVIYLYDINSGSLLKQWNYKENLNEKYNVSLSGIKSGIYVLKVERNNRTASIKISVR